jgi:hypothetical protein
VAWLAPALTPGVEDVNDGDSRLRESQKGTNHRAPAQELERSGNREHHLVVATRHSGQRLQAVTPHGVGVGLGALQKHHRADHQRCRPDVHQHREHPQHRQEPGAKPGLVGDRMQVPVQQHLAVVPRHEAPGTESRGQTHIHHRAAQHRVVVEPQHQAEQVTGQDIDKRQQGLIFQVHLGVLPITNRLG